MLDVNKEMVVSLEEELTFSQNYLALQETRFGSKLRTSFEIEENSRQYYLPPLSLQELIGNAIKHNSIESEHPLRIKVYTRGEELWVENNLQKREEERESTGLGLINIRRRYQILSDKIPIFKVENEHYIAKIPLLLLEA
jgi:LytS/YehU family sensor histidine kinase